jgi:hypothetical protein
MESIREPIAEGTPLAAWLAHSSAASQHDFRLLYDTLTPAHRSVLVIVITRVLAEHQARLRPAPA